jgi:hypothetical protein
VLQPFLFIGVGGSGGDTLRHVYRELGDRLRAERVTRMPAGWQFLYIDSRSTEEFVADLPQLGGGAYVGLTQSGVNYQIVARQLDDKSPASRAAVLGWRPDPSKVHVALEEGAGQYRAIGRAVTVSRLDDLKNKIYQAVDRVRAADMTAVTKALTRSSQVGDQQNPTVVVFASLAGGTGSGTFLDVCDILHGAPYNWAAEPVAVLYAPDVFESLNDNLRRGVQANALAAISEVLAARWGSDPTQDPLHADAGVLFRADGRSGPGYSFLVGAENETGRLTFANQQEVFAAVGRTVGAWASSQAIQKQFSSYVASNWQQLAQLPDPLGLSETSLDMPFSSLGYASLSLGRSLFHQYAAQCLARATAERLLLGSAFGRERTDAENDEIVRQRRAAFHSAVLGLPEDASESDRAYAVIRQLPYVLHRDRQAALDAIRATLRKNLGSGSLSSEAWRARLDDIISEQVDRYLAARRTVLHGQAASWMGRVQQLLCDQVAHSLANDGLVVTSRLVADLADHLANEAAPALDQAAISDDEMAGRYLDEMTKALAQAEPTRRRRGAQRLLFADNEQVRTALNRGSECALGRRFDAVVRRLAAQLVRGVADGLLKPMGDELTRGLHALSKDARSPGAGRPAPIDLWPAGPAFVVPTTLRPSRTQFLIDYVEDYPRIFKDRITRAVPQAERRDDAVPLAVDLILAGDWRETAGVDNLVEQLVTWQPKVAAQWSNSTEQAGAFQIHVTSQNLLDRCARWIEQAPGLGAYLKESLTTALGDAQPTPEQADRLERYEAQFVSALEASRPLVRMNPEYRARYLPGGMAAYAPLLSQIPLIPETPAYELTKELLSQHSSIPKENLDSLFNQTGAGEIEFTTFLNSPCHPIAFASLMEPIQKDWKEKRVNTVQRASFAQWRRARPLNRSVALSADLRQRLVRSWLVSHVRGIVSELVEGNSMSLQLAIADGDETPATFPMFGDVPAVTDPLDCVAAVLESFCLVFVDALDPTSVTVESYRRLLAADTDLGSVPASEVRHRLDELAERMRTGSRVTRRSPVTRISELHDDFAAVIAGLQGWNNGRSV